jgi:hypothetical protein
MNDNGGTTPPAGAEVKSRFDSGWWWAARLAPLLVMMAALAYAADQYGASRTRSIAAPAPVGQIPDNAGYGVGERIGR